MKVKTSENQGGTERSLTRNGLQSSFVSLFNPLTTNVPHHIETSQLICRANQLTSFYMMGNIGRQWVNMLIVSDQKQLFTDVIQNRCSQKLAIFTVNQLCWRLFLIKLQTLNQCNFIKKRLQHRCFPANIAQMLRISSLTEHLWWLFLNDLSRIFLLLNYGTFPLKLILGSL